MTEPLYSKDDLAWYREHYGDTEWMVHVAGPDDCVTHRDEAATEPLTLKDADDLALAVNKFTVSESENSEYAPRMHATVFHYGRPLAAPEDVPAAPGFLADELAFFRKDYGQTAWMIYVHGMDECWEKREEDDQPFTEEGARKLIAKMAVWDREHVAEGLSSTPTTLFHYGVAVEAAAVAR